MHLPANFRAHCGLLLLLLLCQRLSATVRPMCAHLNFYQMSDAVRAMARLRSPGPCVRPWHGMSAAPTRLAAERHER